MLVFIDKFYLEWIYYDCVRPCIQLIWLDPSHVAYFSIVPHVTVDEEDDLQINNWPHNDFMFFGIVFSCTLMIYFLYIYIFSHSFLFIFSFCYQPISVFSLISSTRAIDIIFHQDNFLIFYRHSFFSFPSSLASK